MRTLYARFKDGKGNTSTAVSDSITLAEAGAATYVAPAQPQPVTSTGGNTTTQGSTGTTGYVFQRNLGIGTEGADVVELQKVLRSEGLFTYPTNSGYYGPVTAEAVKRYQQKNGIEATGFVGPLTMKKLNSRGGGSFAKPDDSGLTLEGLIKLFLALGIIPKEKADIAYAALKSH